MKRFINIIRIKPIHVTKLDHFADYQLENHTKEISTFPSSNFGKMTQLRFGGKPNFARVFTLGSALHFKGHREEICSAEHLRVCKKNLKKDEDVTYKHRSNYVICMSSIYYYNFTSKQGQRWIHANHSRYIESHRFRNCSI